MCRVILVLFLCVVCIIVSCLLFALPFIRCCVLYVCVCVWKICFLTVLRVVFAHRWLSLCMVSFMVCSENGTEHLMLVTVQNGTPGLSVLQSTCTRPSCGQGMVWERAHKSVHPNGWLLIQIPHWGCTNSPSHDRCPPPLPPLAWSQRRRLEQGLGRRRCPPPDLGLWTR